MRLIPFFMVIVLLACNSEASNNSEQPESNSPASESAVSSSNMLEDSALVEAASNSSTFEGQYYSVVTANRVQLYEQIENEIRATDLQLERGAVYSLKNDTKASGNYRAITIPGKTEVFYLKFPVQHYDQPLEGMRFPVQGIVQSDDAELEFYDELKGERIRKKLVKGTPYFFVHYKDCAVINVWDIENSRPIQGMYCGKLNIQQASDHIKINPKYKSTLERWFN